MRSILVIDDDESYLDYLSILLSRGGYVVHALRHGRNVAEVLRAQPFHAVVTDLYMPDVDGIEVLLMIKQLAPDLPVIGVTGSSDPSNRAMAALGAYVVLSKPIDATALYAALQRVIGNGSPEESGLKHPSGEE